MLQDLNKIYNNNCFTMYKVKHALFTFPYFSSFPFSESLSLSLSLSSLSLSLSITPLSQCYLVRSVESSFSFEELTLNVNLCMVIWSHNSPPWTLI